MTRFIYVARTKSGQEQRGELEAENVSAALAVLSRQDLLTVDIKIDDERRQSSDWRDIFSRGKHRRFTALFFRRLSVMIDVMPINEILRNFAEDEQDARYRAMLFDIADRIEVGIALAKAMQPYEQIFSPFAVHLIDLGFRSGSLSEILPTVADYTEQRWRRSENMRSAMLYPIILAVTLVLVLALLVGVVLPAFSGFFAGLGAELPLPTRAALAVGEFCREYGALFLPSALVVLALMNYFCRYENFRRKMVRWRLKIPLFGQYERTTLWANVLGSLSVLLKSGMRIDDALLLMIELAENVVVRDVLLEAHYDVIVGRLLSMSLARSEFFPPLAVSFIAVGEKSGQMDFMLKKSADYCRAEADNLAKRIETAAQPAAVLILGAAVTWMVLAVMLPLWSAVETI